MPQEIPEDLVIVPNPIPETPQKKPDIGMLSLCVGSILAGFFTLLTMNHVEINWMWSALAYAIFIIGFVWTFLAHGVPHCGKLIKITGALVIIIGFGLLALFGVHRQYIFQNSPPISPTDTNVLAAVKVVGGTVENLTNVLATFTTNLEQFDSLTKANTGKAPHFQIAIPNSKGVHVLESNDVIQLEIRGFELAVMNDGGSTAPNSTIVFSCPLDATSVQYYYWYPTNNQTPNWKLSVYRIDSILQVTNFVSWYSWTYNAGTLANRALAVDIPVLMITTNFTGSRFPARFMVYSDNSPVQIYPATFLLP